MNDARAARIRRWLQREPRPARVEGTLANGDVVRVAITSSRHALTDATRALYQCISIVALDKENDQLRSLAIGSTEGDADEAEATAAAAPPVTPAQAGAILSIDVPRLVDSIAGAIVRASQSASEQQSLAQRAGFEALGSIVETALRMLNRVERMLPAPVQIEEREDPKNELASALLLQAMSGNHQPAAPSNGVHGITLTPEMLGQLQAMFAGAPPSGE